MNCNKNKNTPSEMISSHLFDKLNFLNYFTHEAGKITCLLKVGKSQKVFSVCQKTSKKT